MRRFPDIAHWHSLSIYWRAVLKHWVFLAVFVGAGAVGLAQEYWTKLAFPEWAWIAIALGALVVAQFLAFHEMREERDAAELERDKEHEKWSLELARASMLFGTELRDIRHKIEIVKSIRPHPIYSHGFKLPAARWGEYDELLSADPDLYAVVERAYTAAHHVNEALDMRRTRARSGQTLGVTPEEQLDAAYEAAGKALDALNESRGEKFESAVERAARKIAEGMQAEWDSKTPLGE